jgi:hypothetical protein
VTWVLTSLEVELVSMPRANNVYLLGMVFQRPHRAVIIDRLNDAIKNTTLTHGTATVGALVVPSVKIAIDQKNADFGIAAPKHKAAAIL